ncbi:MAG: deoxyribodipyrimidine photo-lyase [Verrucomicrobiales bacterium]|nr:deoxyribodipyrimidine photo-lyase [Verrucomicrobiales bacterium]
MTTKRKGGIGLVKRVIHWFRRDLRLSDNTALSAASARAEEVVPVYIFDEAAFRSAGCSNAALAFMSSAVAALKESLRARGYELIIRRGAPETELVELCKALSAEAVFCNKCYEPEEKRVEGRVFAALNGAGFGFESFKDSVVWEEQEILTQAGKPFTVFTPYAKAWKARGMPSPRPGFTRRCARARSVEVRSHELPAEFLSPKNSELISVFGVGEQGGLALLRKFMRDRVYEYAAVRDYPAVEGTSRLSPHLRWGTVGIRTVLAELMRARAEADAPGQRKSCDVFLTELIWREFYNQILANFPHVAQRSFRPEYEAIKWSENREHFQAWCWGMTGYPVVDAAMRCLNATGWLHNRLRMIVAMFLTKDLLINWQWGERYFMQKLVDGDLAANNGGWQWCAGTGTDAAPYFRIFNPVAQGKRFDPRGEFVRRWVPELASAPPELVHEPWKDPSLLKRTGYPCRVVLHTEQRIRALELYKSARSRKAAY